MSGLYEEITTLRSEVPLLSMSHIPVISPVIPSFTQPPPLPHTLVFDLFADDDLVLIIGAKKGCEKELHDSTRDYQHALKKTAHDSTMPYSVDERRCA